MYTYFIIVCIRHLGPEKALEVSRFASKVKDKNVVGFGMAGDEKKFNTNLEFITVDSAATLLTKIILEGPSTKADIILGLDMNLIDQANMSNLFLEHSFNDLNKKINLPIEWESQKFIPYNYGYFAFVYNNKKFKNPPKSMNELINNTKARIVIQDPRTSTPGLGLLTWIKAIYGNEAENKWDLDSYQKIGSFSTIEEFWSMKFNENYFNNKSEGWSW